VIAEGKQISRVMFQRCWQHVALCLLKHFKFVAGGYNLSLPFAYNLAYRNIYRSIEC